MRYARFLLLGLVVVALATLGPRASMFSGGGDSAQAAADSIDLVALDMDPTGNTVAQNPSGNVEETTLGSVEDCVEVTHQAIFDVDFVVQGYPPTAYPLAAYDVQLTFPAGLQLIDTFSGHDYPASRPGTGLPTSMVTGW